MHPISITIASQQFHYSIGSGDARPKLALLIAGMLLLLLAVLPASAHGQTGQGIEFVGTNDLDIANAIAVGRDLNSIFAGSTAPLGGTKSGLIVWRNAVANGGNDLAKTYNLGPTDFAISAIDTCPGSTAIAVVANRTGGTSADALFMQVSATGSVLGTRYFNGSNGETINEVKSLADGTFVVVGSISSSGDGTRRAFAAKIGTAAQSFPLQWVRILGAASGFPLGSGSAVSLEQFADGRLLVCGITSQGTGNSAGVVFLWQLNVNGTQLALQRVVFDAAVIRPVPTDMVITPDQRIVVCGTALTAVGSSKFKGWYLRMNSDLSNPIFRTVSLIGAPNSNLELRAVDAHPSMAAAYAVGTVEVVDESGSFENEAFLMAIDALGNPNFALAPNFNGDDSFNDVQIVSNTVFPFLRAAGGSNRSFHPIINLARTNFLEYRSSESGYSCMRDTYLGIVTRPHTATVSSFSLGLSTSTVTNTILVTVGSPIAGNSNNCAPSRLANPDQDPKGDETPIGDQERINQE